MNEIFPGIFIYFFFFLSHGKFNSVGFLVSLILFLQYLENESIFYVLDIRVTCLKI